MIIHNRKKIAQKKILAIHNSYWCNLKAWVSGYISITAYVDITLTNKKNDSRTTSWLDVFFLSYHVHHM